MANRLKDLFAALRHESQRPMNQVELRSLAMLLALIVVGTLATCQQPLRSAERSVADWLKLTFELREQQHRLDRNDRRFIGYMINWLDVEEMPPTMRQQRWLLDIQRRLDQSNERACGANRKATPNDSSRAVPRACR